MAAGERTIRIKFDGTSKGLAAAAKVGERAVKGFSDKVDKIKDKLDKSGVGAAVGFISGFGSKIAGMLPGVISSLPPQAQAAAVAAGIAIGVAMSSAAAAAITTGILAAVGGIALVAGIRAAAASPRVKAAWGAVADRAKLAFVNFGKHFEEPLVRAANTFHQALQRIGASGVLDRIGKTIAPVIDRLAPALTQMLERALPGIEKAVSASVPLFNTLADQLPRIGVAVNLFFEKIASAGPEANEFFGDMLTLVGNIIVALGMVIAWLTKFYAHIKDGIQGAKVVFTVAWTSMASAAISALGKIIHGAAKAFGFIPGIGDKLRKASTDFAKFADQANAELRKIKDRTVTVRVNWQNPRNPLLEAAKAQASGRRALGGPTFSGRSYLVGENGPEILTMGGQSGRVSPNSAIGSGDVNVEVNLDGQPFYAMTARATRRETKRQAWRAKVGSR